MIDFSNIDYKELLSLLNIQPKQQHGKELYPCLRPHKKGVVYMELKPDGLYCHDCGTNYKHIDLVMESKHLNKTEAMQFLDDNFKRDYSYKTEKKSIPDTTNKALESESKILCRHLTTDKEKRFMSFDKNDLEIESFDNNMLPHLNNVLNKKWSLETLLELQKQGFIDFVKYKKTIPGIAKKGIAFHYHNKALVLNRGFEYTIVVEGGTDFITAYELYKESQVNIIARYNKSVSISVLKGTKHLFILDSDDSIENIKELLKKDSMSFKYCYMDHNYKDLSDSLVNAINSNSVLEYIKENSVFVEYENEITQNRKKNISFLESLILTESDMENVKLEKLIEIDNKPIMYNGTVNLLFANGGVGKSTIAVGLTQKICYENPDVYCYYLDSDNGIAVTKQKGFYNEKPTNWNYINNNKVNINGELFNKIIEACCELALDGKKIIVVIDSLKNFINEMIKDKDIMKFMQVLRDTTNKTQNISFLILHHVNKNGDLKGNNSIRDSVDTCFKLDGRVDKTEKKGYWRAIIDKDKIGTITEFTISFEFDTPFKSMKFFTDKEKIDITDREVLITKIINEIQSKIDRDKVDSLTATELRVILYNNEVRNSQQQSDFMTEISNDSRIKTSKIAKTKYYSLV